MIDYRASRLVPALGASGSFTACQGGWKIDDTTESFCGPASGISIVYLSECFVCFPAQLIYIWVEGHVLSFQGQRCQ